jgi:hypothetical protein
MITPDIRARIWQRIFKSPQLSIVKGIPKLSFSEQPQPHDESCAKAYVLESVVANKIENNKFFVEDEAIYITDSCL